MQPTISLLGLRASASIFCSTAGRACEGVMLVLWRLSMVRAVITAKWGTGKQGE